VQGLSLRRIATEIGVGAAALHRHWRRHAANRDAMPVVDLVARGNETAGSETLERVEPRQPAAVPRPWLSAERLILTHPAGGRPFCWCARCQGRRGHYAASF
jgi:hypothetical protein